MNTNDYRLNAYKNAAKKDSDGTSDIKNHKTIKKPVFERIEKTASAQKPADALFRENKEPSDAEVRAAAAALTRGGLLKVPEPEKAEGGKDSVYRRVAKFMLLIGVDEAAKILPHLSEEQTEKIIPEIASIRTVGDDEAAAILAEFQSLVKRVKEGGGVETAKTILEKAFGQQRASEMMQKTVQFPEGKPFEYLDDADSDRILFLLKDELPAIQALVLSYLKPKKAAEVINLMAGDAKKEVILRLAKMEPILPEVLRRVDHAMHEKADAIKTQKANALDGRNALAQILKKMDPKSESDILKNLSNDDPDLGQDMKQRLFTIDDIVNADDRFVQGTLQKMDNGEIALLIAGKPDDFRKKILSNISTARSDIIIEDEQLKKPVLRADSEKVTSRFLYTMRQAYEDGKFIIKGRSDDIYV